MKRVILLIAILGFFACGRKTDNNTSKIKDDRTELLKTISQTEVTALQATKSIDPLLADSLMNLYDKFNKLYPQDTLCAEMLSKAVDVAANTRNCVMALEFLARITENSNRNEYVEWAYFYKCSVYSDVCNDREKALEACKFFLDNYPQSKQQCYSICLNSIMRWT